MTNFLAGLLTRALVRGNAPARRRPALFEPQRPQAAQRSAPAAIAGEPAAGAEAPQPLAAAPAAVAVPGWQFGGVEPAPAEVPEGRPAEAVEGRPFPLSPSSPAAGSADEGRPTRPAVEPRGPAMPQARSGAEAPAIPGWPAAAPAIPGGSLPAAVDPATAGESGIPWGTELPPPEPLQSQPVRGGAAAVAAQPPAAAAFHANESAAPASPAVPRPHRAAPVPPPAAQPPAPTVQVTIGRVEIRASQPPARAVSPQPAAARLSLDDYLKARSGGGR